MDIAYYLSELLEQLGEVSVPGLGSFTRVRLDGYYNNDEGRFYPPASRLEFTQQDVDDDVLTQYIGVKKRISLASSKYFTEKYITGLKQEVVSREIPFAELGSLYFADGRIRFRGAQTLPDPEFYGYPTISLHKKNTAPVYSYEEPVTAPEAEQSEEGHIIPVLEPFTEEDHLHEPNLGYNAEVKEGQGEEEEEQASYEHIVLYDPEKAKTVVEEQNDNFTPQPEIITPREEEENDFFFRKSIYREPVVEEEVVVEEEEVEPRRSYLWLWITLIVLAVAGGGIYGWYYYQQQQAAPVKKVKAAPAAAPKDTTDSTSTTLPTAKDTAAAANSGKIIPVQNAPASTIDSTKRRYEIIAASANTQKEADKIIKNYRSIGIHAHVVTDAPGKLKKVSLGTYNSPTGVTAAMNDLLKTGKVNKEIWSLPINPKK